MAKARKCNRCERFFDPLKVEGIMGRFINPIFQTSEDIRNNTIGARLIDAEPFAYIDLCPECAEMFEAFMCGADTPTNNSTENVELNGLKLKLKYEEVQHRKASEKMFEALDRARKAEEEVKALEQDYAQLKHILGKEIKILRKENEELRLRAEKYEESLELLKKERDEAHEDLAGMVEENNWLYEMLNVEKTHDIRPLIGKMKSEVLEALRNWDPEEIKKKFVDGMERLFYGETPKVRERAVCEGCKGSDGDCPFHVKLKCDKMKGANE